MFQPDLLHRKRILITGGGTGLGKGMAHRFLELGATVYICGRREQVLSDAEAEMSRVAPGRIRSLACDIRDLAEPRSDCRDNLERWPTRCAGKQRRGKFPGSHGRVVARRI